MKKGGVTESPAKRSRTGSSPETQKKSPLGISREESTTTGVPVLDEGMRSGFGRGKDSGLGFPRPSSKTVTGGGPVPPASRSASSPTGFGGGGLGGASQDWELPDVKPDVATNFVDSWESAVAAQDKQQQQIRKKASQASSHAGVPKPPQFNNHQPQRQTPRTAPVPHQFQQQDNISVITGGSHPGTGFLSGSASVVTNSTSSSANTGVSTGMFSQAMSMSTASSASPRPGIPVVAPFAPSPPQPANPAGSTTTVPKAELYSFFGKKPRRKQLGNEDYMYWNNGAKPHELRFTAIFQDPLTGECFPSGRYGNPQYYQVVKTMNTEGREMEVVWYTKKSYAEHGAAARCFDCLRYRDALQAGGPAAAQALHYADGNDPPYTREQSPGIPQVPPDVGDRIESNKKRIHDFLAGFQS